MAENYVAIRIKAADDAKPDLTELKARLDELKAERADVKVDLEDKDAVAKAAALDARIDALSKRVASPRIDLAGASRAVAELAAVDAAMHRTEAESTVRDKLAMTGANLGKGVGLFGLGSLALSAAGPLAAAGLAVGAFGAVAIPVLTKIGTAQTALTAAQQQYNKVAANESIQLAAATTAKQRASIEVAASKQRAMALDAEKQATAGLTSQQKGLMGQVSQLSGMWSKVEAALTPVVVNVAKVALSVAQDLMPAFQALASVGGNALETILGYLGQFVRTPFFAGFIKEMTQLADQVAPLLGQSLVGVLQVFAQLFEQAGPAGVQLLQVLLPLIVQLAGDLVPVIAAVTKVVVAVLQWLEKTHLLLPVLALVAIAILTMEAPIAAVVAAVAILIAIGVELAKNWHKIWGDIRNWIEDVWNWIKGHWPLLLGILTGPIGLAAAWIIQHWRQITHVFSEVIDWIKGHWKVILAWLVDPIGMAVYEIRTHTHEIAQTFDKLRHDIASILGGLRHDVASAFDSVRHEAATLADDARHAVASAWDGLRHDTAAALDGVVHWFSLLPGRVLHELAALPGQMLSIGRNVIDGLIHGIESAAADIPGIMKSLAGDVESYFTNPLKIFSPSRVFFEHGQDIVQGAVLGVQAGAPRLTQAMGRLAGGVAAGGLGRTGYGGYGGAAGGGAIILEFHGSSQLDEAMWKWLRQGVRVQGGDPDMFQRKVVFQ